LNEVFEGLPLLAHCATTSNRDLHDAHNRAILSGIRAFFKFMGDIGGYLGGAIFITASAIF
jgi:hypothetical protein